MPDSLPSPSPDSPDSSSKRKKGLSVPQLRVLRALDASRGPLSRKKLAEATHTNATYVSWAVGRSEPELRVKFENTRDGGFRPSLLSLGYVEEILLDIDGVQERCVALTAAGKKATDDTAYIIIPDRTEDESE